jgi:hypothetical protein
MKKTLLTLFLFCFVGSLTFAQVVGGQIDDFEDDTVQGWVVGPSSSGPPTNITTGGPNGAGDNFLQYISLGGGGPDSKMIVYNQVQWTGDFTAQGIVAVEFDIKVETNDLNIRVAFDGGGGRFCTSTAVSVTAGSGWNHIVIPISSGDFTSVGGSNIGDTLEDVNTMRILSNTVASWQGEGISATMQLDNIEAATSLSLDKVKTVDFSIYPNPSKSKLNINLVQNNVATKVEVYDILGKRVYANSLTDLKSSINASNWNSGVYLVKISNDLGTQTKRFVKQ